MSLIYSTLTFSEVWEEAADFERDWQSTPFYREDTSIVSASLLYYLLYARYGNSPIANADVEQFKMKIFSIMFQYGPTWAKRLDIQKKLRALSDDELITGAKTIYNHAFNPNTVPSTAETEELRYINDQNTSHHKRSKLDGYSLLLELLDADVTGDFIAKFAKLFKQFVSPEEHYLYITNTEVDE